jgi:hypothetical protein
MSELCTHLDQVELHDLPASVDGCEDCLRDGSKWLHLRICLTCGHVGCCDDSPNRHATAHHHATSHPISCTESEDDHAIRRASCVRDFTPSLRNTLRRWYSTVLGLMNS